MAKVSKSRQQECRTRLLELLQPGDRVFGDVTQVSRSGMSRTIDFHVYRGDPRNPARIWLTPFIGDLLGWSWGDRGVKVQGCGMDMVFHTIYSTAYALWPKGYTCSGKGCGSNDHSNAVRDADHKVVAGAPKADGIMHHTDGGYALVDR